MAWNTECWLLEGTQASNASEMWKKRGKDAYILRLICLFKFTDAHSLICICIII